MLLAVALGPIRQAGIRIEIALTELHDHRVVQRIRDGAVDLARIDHLGDPGVPRLGFRRTAAGIVQRSVEVGDPLLVHEATVGGHDVVRELEVENALLGGARLLPQFPHPVLEPLLRPLRGLELRLELVGDVGFRNLIGDARRLLGASGDERDPDDVGHADPFRPQAGVEGPGAMAARSRPIR